MIRSPPPHHKRSSSTMTCWLILLWKIFFACQYFWKPSGLSKLNFFSSEKRTFHYSLAFIVWYWWAYFSCFSECFIVGRWIIFLCLIILLFKCLLIVLVLQGASTRNFYVFDVDKVFFFTSETIFLLNCSDNFSCLTVVFFLLHTYLDFSSNYR